MATTATLASMPAAIIHTCQPAPSAWRIHAIIAQEISPRRLASAKLCVRMRSRRSVGTGVPNIRLDSRLTLNRGTGTHRTGRLRYPLVAA